MLNCASVTHRYRYNNNTNNNNDNNNTTKWGWNLNTYEIYHEQAAGIWDVLQEHVTNIMGKVKQMNSIKENGRIQKNHSKHQKQKTNIIRLEPTSYSI